MADEDGVLEYIRFERATKDTGVPYTGSGGAVSPAGGDVERALAEPLSSDLATAFDKLRECKFYTDFMNDPGVPLVPLVGAAFFWIAYSHMYEQEHQEKKSRLNEVYNTDNGYERYWEDRRALEGYLQGRAQKIGAAVVQRRQAINNGLRAKYGLIGSLGEAEKRDALASLADACARMLVFRTGMPFPMIVERSGVGDAPVGDWLELRDATARTSTADDIERLINFYTPSYVPPTDLGDISDWIGTSLETDPEAEPAASAPEVAVDPYERSRRASSAMLSSAMTGQRIWEARWGNWSSHPDHHGSPFRNRFIDLWAIHSDLNVESNRREIYTQHPIAAILHLYVSPSDLADILRIRHVDDEGEQLGRNSRLMDLIEKVAVAMDEVNADMLRDLAAENPDELGDPTGIDWGKYNPLLQTAASFILNTEGDELESLCVALYGTLDPWTWMERAEMGLAIASIALVCVFPPGAVGVSPLVGWLALALDVGGLYMAYRSVLDARLGGHQDRIEEQYDLISDDLAGIEVINNPNSVKGAYLGMFLELLGITPFGAIAKVARGSLRTVNEGVDVMRALDSGVHRSDELVRGAPTHIPGHSTSTHIDLSAPSETVPVITGAGIAADVFVDPHLGLSVRGNESWSVMGGIDDFSVTPRGASDLPVVLRHDMPESGVMSSGVSAAARGTPSVVPLESPYLVTNNNVSGYIATRHRNIFEEFDELIEGGGLDPLPPEIVSSFPHALSFEMGVVRHLDPPNAGRVLGVDFFKSSQNSRKSYFSGEVRLIDSGVRYSSQPSYILQIKVGRVLGKHNLSNVSIADLFAGDKGAILGRVEVMNYHINKFISESGFPPRWKGPTDANVATNPGRYTTPEMVEARVAGNTNDAGISSDDIAIDEALGRGYIESLLELNRKGQLVGQVDGENQIELVTAINELFNVIDRKSRRLMLDQTGNNYDSLLEGVVIEFM